MEQPACLRPWSPHDLDLLRRNNSDPIQMAHVGGPEPDAKIAERQARYERPDSHQFVIIERATKKRAGWVGFWERHWQSDEVYEIGWSVLPGFQGRALASSAARQAVQRAADLAQRRFVHAFPHPGNAPSNAVCRSAGFTLLGPVDFEYPPGQIETSNDWRYDLETLRHPHAA